MTVARNLPSTNADGQNATPSRTGTYLEAYVLPLGGKETLWADEATYHMALTPTPGTGVIGTASIAAITDVSPTMVLYNASTTKRIYPQFLNLYETVVSTSGARVQFTFYLDNINRYTSGGTLLVNGCTNSGGTTDTALVGHVGAIVSPAQNAKVLIDHVVFRGTIDVVEDCYEFIFGSIGGGQASGSRVATVQDFSRTLPPVVIQPGHSLVMHQWAASQANAPTYEYRLGYCAR